MVSSKQLELLFQSLVMSLFGFGIRLWEEVSHTYYISPNDKFIHHAYCNAYIAEMPHFRKVVSEREETVVDENIKQYKNNVYELKLLPNKLN